MSEPSPGEKLRSALAAERPLQMAGVINAYAALLAERAGFRALYISGAGVANASYGLPDLALTTLNDVLIDVRRVTSITNLPVLVDIDTGWGPALMIDRTIKEMQRAGAAAVQIEDQVAEKRCGHRPGKELAPPEEMVDRIRSASAARLDPGFAIVARTDALAVEGLDRALDRARRYAGAGADLLFAEACTELEQYRQFGQAAGVPVVANMTEFGKTPPFTTQQLADAGVDVALYPLSAFRAMSKAAESVYGAIRRDGSQRAVLDRMQTREQLYDVIGYYEYERKMDELMGQRKA